MTQLILIPFLFILTGFRGETTGDPGDYPIPSFNIQVEGYANFVESGQDQVTAKRAIRVYVHSESGGNASVWIYKLDRSVVLGPFTVRPGETLNEEIDDASWGALVYSEQEDIVDVWIE